jgi:DNA-binding transcriptional regulator GbsR (MarR family)
MTFDEARAQFIAAWGTLGVEWGISRNSAQVHALLLSSSQPLTLDEIVAHLGISKGSASMSTRFLIDWQLVRRGISGDGRRDAFEAEADVWEMSRRIVLRRRQRELEPLVALLGRLVEFRQPPADRSAEAQRFRGVLTDLHALGRNANRVLDLALKLDRTTFFRRVLTRA